MELFFPFVTEQVEKSYYLNNCILVDSSTLTGLTSPFVILGVSSLFKLSFFSIFDGNPVCKHYRP